MSDKKPTADTTDTDAPREISPALRAAGWTRLFAGIPALGLVLASAVLTILTTYEAFAATIHHFTEAESHLAHIAVEYVEFADVYLLAVALYILGLGLFSLFVNDNIPLPDWLEFHDFDDLKERLISVICVMLAVYFLQVVLSGTRGLDLVWLGRGIAAVIAALTFFVRFVFKNH